MIHSILKRRLIVCVGPGGVGKTTTAAALALAAAKAGRRAVVITFDPAKRLKDALGLAGLPAEPVPVEVEGVTFDALALDTKRTFDAIVRRFAATPAAAEQVLANRLYQEISNGLSGSAEYMAMEKLHELLHHHDYDLVVVDTPPSANAKDLLAAPNRLAELLATRAVSFLQAPASLLSTGASTAARMTFSALLKALERWTGLQLLSDLADFVTGFESMLEGFQQRAGDVDAWLRSPDSAFVLVTTPEAHTLETTIRFHHELVRDRFRVAGIIANRVLAFSKPKANEDPLFDAIPEALRAKLTANQRDLYALSRRDRLSLQRLHDETSTPLLAVLPQVTFAPTSLETLSRFSALL